MIDTHQHLWVRSERQYDWILPEHGILYADFRPEDIAAEAVAAGITATILVQAADTYEDTFYMLSVAARHPSIVGVVGWVPLDRPDEALAALDLYAKSPIIRGVRALTHTYEDVRWILRADVAKAIDRVEALGLSLDYVAVVPEHLDLIPELARQHPRLRIVVDHLGSPPIARGDWEPWASSIAGCAAEPNVFIKLSGLSTLSGDEWTAADWRPYVDHVASRFGSDRMMLGSDWPVSLLAGDFARTWNSQLDAIAHLPKEARDDIVGSAAIRAYALGS